MNVNDDVKTGWKSSAAEVGVQRQNMSGAELCANGLEDALLDEAEELDFYIVAGELV